MKRRHLLLAAIALAAGSATTHAQDAYPSSPVRLIVPFPAAGPLDLLARIVSQGLNEQWGQPVVVENKAGAAGGIGADAVGMDIEWMDKKAGVKAN